MIYYRQFFRRTVFLSYIYCVLSSIWVFDLPDLSVSVLAGDWAGSGYMGSWHGPRQETALLFLIAPNRMSVCKLLLSGSGFSPGRGGGGGVEDEECTSVHNAL